MRHTLSAVEIRCICAACHQPQVFALTVLPPCIVFVECLSCAAPLKVVATKDRPLEVTLVANTWTTPHASVRPA